MSRFVRVVHSQSNFQYDSCDAIAPDLGLKFESNDPRSNGSDPASYTPKALAFTDPDGETHVYPMTEEARENLVRMLTGGIIVPGPS